MLSGSCKMFVVRRNPLNNMPFKSKSQARACYASKGFGGGVNCAEWAKKTNFGKLKEKVQKATKTTHKSF